MGVELIFPPIWPSDMPYLSLPTLAAFLRTRRPEVEVGVRDFNVGLWQHLRSEERLRGLWEWAARRVRAARTADFDGDSDGLLLLLEVTRFATADEFVTDALRGEVPRSVLDRCLAFHACWRMGEFDFARLRGRQRDYFHADPVLSAMSLARHATTAVAVSELADAGVDRNPYRGWLSALLDAASLHVPTLFGLSIVGTAQVVPAFTLARLLRERWPDAAIIVGGPWGSHHLLGDPARLAGLMRYVDGFVRGDGEFPLLEIIDRVSTGEDLSGVPGLYRWQDGQVVAPSMSHRPVDLATLPTPDFNGLPLHLYERTGLRPLQASRGCSWNRCTFCSFVALDPGFRTRPAAQVARDVEALVDDGASEIAFVDSILDPQHVAEFTAALFRSGVRVGWRGYARFDPRYTPDLLRQMAGAGCRALIWGLESASPRLLHDMRKGTPLKVIDANLRASKDANIASIVNLIYDYPGETEADRIETFQFLRGRMDLIESIAFCHYAALRETPLALGPSGGQRRGLREPAPLALHFERTDEIDSGEGRRIEQQFRALALEVARRRNG